MSVHVCAFSYQLTQDPLEMFAEPVSFRHVLAFIRFSVLSFVVLTDEIYSVHSVD